MSKTIREEFCILHQQLTRGDHIAINREGQPVWKYAEKYARWTPRGPDEMPVESDGAKLTAERDQRRERAAMTDEEILDVLKPRKQLAHRAEEYADAIAFIRTAFWGNVKEASDMAFWVEQVAADLERYRDPKCVEKRIERHIAETERKEEERKRLGNGGAGHAV